MKKRLDRVCPKRQSVCQRKKFRNKIALTSLSFLPQKEPKQGKTIKMVVRHSISLVFTTKKNHQENTFLMEANSAWKQTRALRPGKRGKDRTNMAGIEWVLRALGSLPMETVFNERVGLSLRDQGASVRLDFTTQTFSISQRGPQAKFFLRRNNCFRHWKYLLLFNSIWTSSVLSYFFHAFWSKSLFTLLASFSDILSKWLTYFRLSLSPSYSSLKQLSIRFL